MNSLMNYFTFAYISCHFIISYYVQHLASAVVVLTCFLNKDGDIGWVDSHRPVGEEQFDPGAGGGPICR